MLLDLDRAIKAHIDWLGRLMQALQTHHVSADLRRETCDGACLFGQWLAREAVAQGYDAETLQPISACHRTMHAEASALLQPGIGDEDYFAALERFCRTAVAFNRLAAAQPFRQSA